MGPIFSKFVDTLSLLLSYFKSLFSLFFPLSFEFDSWFFLNIERKNLIIHWFNMPRYSIIHKVQKWVYLGPDRCSWPGLAACLSKVFSHSDKPYRLYSANRKTEFLWILFEENSFLVTEQDFDVSKVESLTQAFSNTRLKWVWRSLKRNSESWVLGFLLDFFCFYLEL